jgi:hypothetical protein
MVNTQFASGNHMVMKFHHANNAVQRHIAAVEGYAVAGGLELAPWCDMRVAAGVPVDGWRHYATATPAWTEPCACTDTYRT